MIQTSALRADSFCPASGHGASFKVLIVDDDQHVAAHIKDMFSEIGGYDTDIALSPYEGLGKLARDRYDMVLSDILMPGMNGIEFLQSVKFIDASLPVVMITGFPTVEIAIQAMKEGATDFISKPFRFNQLHMVAERVMRERTLLLENAKLVDALKNKQTIERLNLRLNAKIHEISTLYSVSELFSAIPMEDDLSVVYKNITDMALEITGFTFAMLMIVDVCNHQLLPAATTGLAGYRIAESIPLCDLHMANELALLREPLVMLDPEKVCAQSLGILDAEFFCSACMLLPLRIKDEPFGILVAGTRDTAKTFNGSDNLLLKNLLRKAGMAIENRLLYDSIFANMRDTLHALVTAIEARDQYTLKHSLRVTDYSIRIAAMLGCTQEEIDVLRSAGHLHDIGKIGISDTILLKSCELSPSEFSIIHQHPVIGENILKPLGFLPLERGIIRYHHERWDGTGYPDGLKGEEIPLLSRILAVADSYDAMTTDRPYRQALQQHAALQELCCCSQQQFDFRVVDAFMECMRV